MADSIGSIKYDFTIDTSKANKGVSDAKKAANDVANATEQAANKSESSVSQAMNKIGASATNAAKKIGSKLVSMTATVAKAGAAAVGAMAVASVKMYADYEQNIGGVETLFKNSAKTVEEYANSAYKAAGMSANAYMETVTMFSARLISGLGGDTEKAAQLANMAVQDMSDNANKMGTDIESLQNAYQGFAKQNYTMLDNLKLEYGGTASEMARLINKSGVLGDTMKVTANNVNEVSFDKIVEAIHIVQTEWGITGTTAKEAAETISGSANTMRAAWDNLLTFLGGGEGNLDEVMNNFVESVKTFGKNVIPVAKSAIKGIAEVVTELAPLIVAELPQLINEILPSLLEATTQIVISIASALPGILVTLTDALLDAIPTLVDAIVNIAPILFDAIIQIAMKIIQRFGELSGKIREGILQIVKMLTAPENLSAILEAGLQLLLELAKALPQAIIELVNALPDIIANIVSFLIDPKNIYMIIEAAIQLFMGLVQAVPQILGALIGAFGNLFGKLWENVTRMFSDFAGNFGNTIGNIFKGAVNGVIGFIENFINLPINAINGFLDIINGLLGAVGVNIGKIPNVTIPRLYTGGIVEGQGGGRVIVAGDGGEDEWVVPESKMASLLEQIESRSLGNGGANITINVMGTFATSASEQRKVAEQIYQRLQELDRSRFGGLAI